MVFRYNIKLLSDKHRRRNVNLPLDNKILMIRAPYVNHEQGCSKSPSYDIPLVDLHVRDDHDRSVFYGRGAQQCQLIYDECQGGRPL